MTVNNRLEKFVEGIDRFVIVGAVSVFMWRDWRKSRNIDSGYPTLKLIFDPEIGWVICLPTWSLCSVIWNCSLYSVVHFILSPSVAASSRRKPASAENLEHFDTLLLNKVRWSLNLRRIQACYARKFSWLVPSKAGVTCIVKSVSKDIHWRVYTIYFCVEHNVGSECKIAELKW
jgi:hypothetical protein